MRQISYFSFTGALACSILVAWIGSAESQPARFGSTATDVCHLQGTVVPAPPPGSARIVVVERWADGSFARVPADRVLTKEELQSATYTGGRTLTERRVDRAWNRISLPILRQDQWQSHPAAGCRAQELISQFTAYENHLSVCVDPCSHWYNWHPRYLVVTIPGSDFCDSVLTKVLCVTGDAIAFPLRLLSRGGAFVGLWQGKDEYEVTADQPGAWYSYVENDDGSRPQHQSMENTASGSDYLLNARSIDDGQLSVGKEQFLGCQSGSERSGAEVQRFWAERATGTERKRIRRFNCFLIPAELKAGL